MRGHLYFLSLQKLPPFSQIQEEVSIPILQKTHIVLALFSRFQDYQNNGVRSTPVFLVGVAHPPATEFRRFPLFRQQMMRHNWRTVTLLKDHGFQNI